MVSNGNRGPPAEGLFGREPTSFLRLHGLCQHLFQRNSGHENASADPQRWNVTGCDAFVRLIAADAENPGCFFDRMGQPTRRLHIRTPAALILELLHLTCPLLANREAFLVIKRNVASPRMVDKHFLSIVRKRDARGRQVMPQEPRRKGRPPKKGEPGVRASLGLKVTSDIKRRLDAAARANGRTQSQEAEARLERSFQEELLLPQLMDLAYGRQTAGLLMLIGSALRTALPFFVWMEGGETKSERPPSNWLHLPQAYRQAKGMISTILGKLDPLGPDNAPAPEWQDAYARDVAAEEVTHLDLQSPAGQRLAEIILARRERWKNDDRWEIQARGERQRKGGKPYWGSREDINRLLASMDEEDALRRDDLQQQLRAEGERDDLASVTGAAGREQRKREG